MPPPDPPSAGPPSSGEDPAIKAILDPLGVAVVGASGDPEKLGYALARNLLLSGFPGAVHFVNPGGGTLFGRPVHRDVASVPDPVDLAVVLVPAPAVPEVLEACGARGIRAAIVGSGGFRETGAEGAAREERILDVARRHGMRLLGPNCIGVLDTHVPIDTTFLPPPGPTPGTVAFLSHSGAICAAVIDWARGQGFGLSRLVSLGNQADLSETELLPLVAGDPHTRVVTLYLEAVRDGRRFVESASRVSGETPVVALKVGRRDAGRRAMASHTGALAGSEAAYDAAFRRAGVLRADTAEEMFDWARALSWCPVPAGPRVAILTDAGGPAVAAADAVEGAGMELASLSPDTVTELESFLPAAAALDNPVDMLASASPRSYTRALRALLADDGVDSVMIVLVTPPLYTAAGVVNAFLPVVHTATKPVVVAIMGERLIQEAVERLRAAHVPDYRFPERAASALAALWRRSEMRSDHPLVPRPPGAGPHPARDRPEDLLADYGIPVVGTVRVDDAEGAVDAAVTLGFPVVLKAEADGLVHKTDVGGVVTGLGTPDEVRTAFGALERTLAGHGLRMTGASVQEQATAVSEVIVGAVRDPQFGPLVMYGSGGVEVEALGDVAFALAPLTAADVRHLLDRTWAGRSLAGFRGAPPADREAVVDVLVRMAYLAADHPELEELEINPLLVGSEGAGVVAVDVRGRWLAGDDAVS